MRSIFSAGAWTSAALLLLAGTAAAQHHKALGAELTAMVERDQAARRGCVANGKAEDQAKCLVQIAETVDKPNSARINEIFLEHGFPTVALVGKDGVKAFFLILQHSGDKLLKEKARAGVESAFAEKALTPSDYAAFIDRSLVDAGKPQIYGSNFETKDGRLVMSPTEDLPNLDKRRAKIGLPPIAEYARLLIEFYKLEVVVPQQD